MKDQPKKKRTSGCAIVFWLIVCWPIALGDPFDGKLTMYSIRILIDHKPIGPVVASSERLSDIEHLWVLFLRAFGPARNQRLLASHDTNPTMQFLQFVGVVEPVIYRGVITG